ncbi:MAG: hypothetical protein Q9174_005266, partial [Haloplaca sp. 1 TL-2023]
MDSMEIDSGVLVPVMAGVESGIGKGHAPINEIVNGGLASSKVMSDSKSLNRAVGQAGSNLYAGFISHYRDQPSDSGPQLPLPHDQDGRLSQTSSAEDYSSSEDELVEGETSWTHPLIPPKMLPTGLVYDVRMRYHCELDPPKQRLDFHPEDPRRIYHIYRELCQAGLYKDPQFNVPLVDQPLQRILAREATPSEICLVHTVDHYNFVASTAGKVLQNRSKTTVTNISTAQTEEDLIHLERTLDSVYVNKLTFASALLSTGGAIETCKAVMSGKVKNGIAVIRPPGHHAECN